MFLKIQQIIVKNATFSHIILCFLQILQKAMNVWQAESHVAFLPESGSLYFRSAQLEDEGEYACILKSEKTADSTIKLLIQGKLNELTI